LLPESNRGEAVPSETDSPKKDGKQPYRIAQQPILLRIAARKQKWGGGSIRNRLPKKKDGKQPYRTAQQPTLAAFLPWGSSAGAGRTALAGTKVTKNSNRDFMSKNFKSEI